MTRYRLDVAELYAELDAKRRHEGLNWAQVAYQSGVPAPRFSRMANGIGISADTYLSLIGWLGGPYRLALAFAQEIAP